MSASSSKNVQQAWNHFLQEVELAKNYHMPYLLDGFGGTFRNPLLDCLLPSLLYIKLAAILDDALICYIDGHNLTVPRQYKKSLHGRIEYLEVELQHLSLLGCRQGFEYFGERSKMRDCDEPGVAFAQDFRFGIKSNDVETMAFSFTRKTYKSDK